MMWHYYWPPLPVVSGAAQLRVKWLQRYYLAPDSATGCQI
jgi:hypothetical protein